MTTDREKMGRLVLEASTGVYGAVAKKLALELSAALAAPPVERQAAQVISVEDSLRTLLRWERERVEALEDELRTLLRWERERVEALEDELRTLLRSKLPGAAQAQGESAGGTPHG